MDGAKILIYRYFDDHEEEEETDLTGEIAGEIERPRMGDIIYRKEKTWKITVYAGDLTDPIPRVRIHLMNILVALVQPPLKISATPLYRKTIEFHWEKFFLAKENTMTKSPPKMVPTARTRSSLGSKV